MNNLTKEILIGKINLLIKKIFIEKNISYEIEDHIVTMPNGIVCYIVLETDIYTFNLPMHVRLLNQLIFDILNDHKITESDIGICERIFERYE